MMKAILFVFATALLLASLAGLSCARLMNQTRNQTMGGQGGS